ncbi:MAG: hypothetical protein BGO12_01100 [Verrucomicrobia bacterium 61-8]|nr:MAG: hypothetical protein BGO12_01100 [Verrucomicrobia bacterium 61-8]
MKTLILAIAITTLGLVGVSHAADAAPKPYPLTTCVVSGEGLDSMGKPVVFVYEGQEVKLCCKKCKTSFDKDPAKFIKQIQDAK